MKAIENVEAQSVPSSELAAMHGSRAKIYSLLARLFRVEIDPLFLDQLKAMRLPAAATGNEKMDAGYRKFARYLGQTDSSTLTELTVDYVRAFIGHGIDAHSAAYPFESVYTIAKRLMMQGARDEVMALYRSEGMDKTTEFKEAEDHIAPSSSSWGSSPSAARPP